MPTCFIVLLASTLASTAGCVTEQRGSEVVARLRPNHPRLMLTPDTAAQIRASLASDPWLRARYDSQKKSADDLLAQPPSEYQLVGGDGLLDVSRQVLTRVATLALMYRLDGDQRYLTRCWAELDAAAHFRNWDQSHSFLCVAEMTAAFAIGYDWLYPDWTDHQRNVLRNAIIELGLRPGLEVYRHNPDDWPSENNNWNIVCNGGMTMGALAIAEDSPQLSREILGCALDSIPRALEQFSPDGGWPEGPMYWAYATLYEAMFFSSLQTACGSDMGLAEIRGVSQGGWFPVYLNGPAAGAFNFGDADEDRDPRSGPQLLWMARQFNEPRYAQYQIDHTGGRVAAFELVWGVGANHTTWQTIPPDRLFRRIGVATMRDTWDDPHGWYVGFKAGDNTASHSHLDVGSFVLDAKGVRWAIALGADNYDLPGYFAKKDQRWTYYRLRAEGNNTLAINPGRGPDQDPQGAGKITHFEPTADGVNVTADLTGVYPAADKVTRSMIFTRGRSLEIRDIVKLKNTGDVWWFMQTRASARLADGGRSLLLTQDGQSMRLQLLRPPGARFQVGPARPLPTSPHPRGQAANQGVTRIAIHIPRTNDATIETLFE
jgi:hypothetical protein